MGIVTLAIAYKFGGEASCSVGGEIDPWTVTVTVNALGIVASLASSLVLALGAAQESPAGSTHGVSSSRVLVAWLIDFAFLLSALSAPVCVLLLTLETGQVDVQGEFIRQGWETRDLWYLLVGVLSLLGLPAVHGFLIRYGRSLPGCALAGIAPSLSRPVSYARCAALSMFAFLFHVSFFYEQDQEQLRSKYLPLRLSRIRARS